MVEQAFSILNVRSTASGDLTTRSKIRDAAILLFGRSGFDKTTVREIASEAGGSAGLVIHHFGSKEQLRTACDEHVVAEIMGRKGELTEGNLSATMQRWLADIDAYRPLLDYLSRMLVDGTASGDSLFDDLIVQTETMLADGRADGSIRDASDPRVTAVMVAAHGIMPLILERHIARALGESGLTAAAIRRMTIPTLELYTTGLYATDAYLEAARDALALTEETRRDNNS